MFKHQSGMAFCIQSSKTRLIMVNLRELDILSLNSYFPDQFLSPHKWISYQK